MLYTRNVEQTIFSDKDGYVMQPDPDLEQLVKLIAALPDFLTPAQRRLYLRRHGFADHIGNLNFDQAPKAFSDSLVDYLDSDAGTIDGQPALCVLVAALLKHDMVKGHPDKVAFLERLCAVGSSQPSTQPLIPSTQTRSTTILFLAANPLETSPLKLGEEARAIEEALKRTSFVVQQAWALQHTDLQEALLRYRPTIVHFSGHGARTGELILQNEQGQAHPVSPAALRNLFAILKDDIRCVVLNACWSESLAQTLTEVIDGAVGMARAIDDPSALRFSAGFYGALPYGRCLQDAYDLGCNAVDLANLPSGATPQLRTRPGLDAKQICFG